MSKSVTITVEIEVPEIIKGDVTPEDILAYTENAVTSWRGSLQPPGWSVGGAYVDEPGNPLFMLDPDKMKFKLGD